MSSSGSSSSSSKAKRKKDKSKKDKKAKKGKKAKKDDKKQKKGKKDDKRIENAKEWFCDRLDAVKYTRQLLEIDANVATELEALFEMLDEGEVVRVDGLENKQVKKKLRHLLQALKLTPVDENGFKSADRKVLFTWLFNDCLRRANEKNAAEVAAAKAATPEVISLDAEPDPAPVQELTPADARAADAAECGEEDPAFAEGLPLPSKPKRPRLKGPQLPMPGIGVVEGSEDEGSSDEADGQGPRLAGEERRGIDLSALPSGPARETWMTDAGKYGSMFAEGGGPRKGDKYEVKRTKAEIEAAEKMMQEKKEMGSLLQQTKEGNFAREDAKNHTDEMHNKLKANEEMWGMSEKQQDRQRLVANAAGGAPGLARKPFNPEEDLKVKKPMAAADFNKFVEEAGSQMAGRFHRGQGSFL